MALVAVLFGLLAYVGISLTRESGRIALLWLPNAVVAAVLLRSKSNAWPLYVAACVLANVVVNRIVGDSWWTAIGLSVANASEILVVVSLMRWSRGRRPDMADIDSHIWLLASALVGAVLSATVASLFLARSGSVLSLQDWERWVIADGLSLLILLPITLVAIDAWSMRRRPTRKASLDWLVMVAMVTAGTCLIFTQTTFPFLFLVSPLVLYAAFRTGLTGTAVAVLIVTVIASIATVRESGPIALVQGGPELRLIAFQVFLAAHFAIGFPVAAMLNQRARDRADLRTERDEKQEILDNIRDVIFRTNAEGCWTSLNPAWEQLTGYTVAESLGWPTTRLLHPEDRVAARTIYPQIACGTIGEATLQQRFIDRPGNARHIEVSIRRLANDDGVFEGTIGNIRDVTEQVHQARELEESEGRFRRLAESAPVGIFRANAAGELTYINPGWAAKVGKTVEQMLGRGWLTAVADTAPFVQDPPFRNFQPGELRRRIIQFRGADGGDLWMETYNSAEFDESGAIKGYYGAAVDVSDARQLEADLRLARRKAEDAASAKSAFLANMSHEIRTPMNGVLGFTELLGKSELDETQRNYVQLIADSGREMMRLLNDILDISKIEAGLMRVSLEPVDLRHKLNGIVRLMDPIASEKGLALSLDIAPEVPEWLMADALRLRQVVLNLVGNALKFTERGSVCVSVSAIDAGRSLQIDVVDSGIGIAAENQQAVFQQFTQADSSVVRRFGGSGLGLAISRQLVELMGGNISLTSEIGKGSTFTVVLPLVATDPPMPASPSSLAPAPGTEPVPQQAIRLLVAEDNDINQKLIHAMALKAGCIAHIVADGAEAVRAIAQAEAAGAPYALVLMDLQMPVMDGLTATKTLRSDGYDAERLPIVALTANAYPEDIALCTAAGMQGHIAKPLRVRDLIEVLERVVTKSPGTTSVSAAPTPVPAVAPDLVVRYRNRKAALHQSLTALTETSDDAQWAELAGALHQLAGVAAIFGEAELGETARIMERRLRQSTDPALRLAIVAEALIALEAATESATPRQEAGP